jgi:hypothetical protein
MPKSELEKDDEEDVISQMMNSLKMFMRMGILRVRMMPRRRLRLRIIIMRIQNQ